jgi:hypothetical protein
MPTAMELAGLFDKSESRRVVFPSSSGEIHLTAHVQTTARFIWASDTSGPNASSSYYFQNGGGLWMPQSMADDHRALPVRSAK